MLEIDSRLLECVPLLVLRGRFDGAGAARFDQTCAEGLAGSEGPLLLDLAGVDFLSSAGLRSLVRLARSPGPQRRIGLIGLPPLVKQVFEVAGLLDQFDVMADQAEAVERLRATRSGASKPEILEHGGQRLRVSRLSGCPGRLDIWRHDPAAPLTCLSLSELGLALGRGGLGHHRDQAAEAAGPMLATPNLVAIKSREASAAPADFMASDRPGDVPVYVESAWRFAGEPDAWVVADAGEASLGDALEALLGIPGAEPSQREIGRGWLLAAEDPSTPGQGWVVVGCRTGTGEQRMESIRVTDLVLDEQPRSVDHFLRATLREEAIADQQPFPEHIGRWQAWRYIFSEARDARATRPEVVFDGETDPPEEWDWIARHLYPEAGRLSLRRLCGGFSAATFHAESWDVDGRRLLPTVLKLADPAFSERENRAYDLYVRNYILNNSAVRMGHCSRNQWVGLRYNFLGITGKDGRLSWIGEHFVQRPVEEVLPLFKNLFERILVPWYGQARPAPIQPYREHDPRHLFPGLVAEARSVLGLSADEPRIPCPPLGRSLPNPYYLLEHVYPRRAGAAWPGLVSISHGDLNLNNILVDEKENLYVIDFSETSEGDLGGDFSRMEPLLLLQMTRLQDEADLVALLRYLSAVVRPDTLFDPPDAYTGGDPFMPKAHALVKLLRGQLRRFSWERCPVVPYLLGLLRWALPIVVFRQMPSLRKQLSCYASAVLAEALLEADPEAALLFR